MHTLQLTTLEETKCHVVLLAIVLLRQANSCYCTRPHVITATSHAVVLVVILSQVHQIRCHIVTVATKFCSSGVNKVSTYNSVYAHRDHAAVLLLVLHSDLCLAIRAYPVKHILLAHFSQLCAKGCGQLLVVSVV
jgi:hypothetical protein